MSSAPRPSRARAARWVVAAGLVALAGWVALAYGGPRGVECTLVGADPGVAVRSERGEAIPADWTIEIQASERWVTAEGLDEVRFATLRLRDEGQQQLRVRVTDGQGRIVAQEAVEVDVTPYSPNGEDCPPTVGRATVSVSPDGDIA